MSDDVTIRHQEPADLPAMRQIVETAWASGELASFSQREISRWLEGLGIEPESTLVALVGDEVAGFLAINRGVVIVAPHVRRRGIGRALVDAALAQQPDLELSVPQGSTAAEPFLSAIGFRFDHYLRRLQLAHGARPAAPVLPEGFLLRHYAEADFDRYLALINDTFADHPTPLQVTETQVRWVHNRPEFDASLIALIAKADDPAELVAFTHLRTPYAEGNILKSGIGMVGVRHDYRRLGLGRQLLRWGIHRLRQAGCKEIVLEVVDTNERALPLYEREGFMPAESWPYWKSTRARSE